MVKCRNCNVDIINKPTNIFCSKSCSVSYNNKNRTLNEKTKLKIKNSVNAWCLNQNMNVKIYKICKNCNENLNTKSQGRKFCDIKCRTSFNRKHLNEYQKYRRECMFKFNVFNYENYYDLNLIKEHGIYKAKNRGNNLNGISRDHMYSVYDGFKNNISPELISHPANCRLIKHVENSRKHTKSIITILELKRRIELWERQKEKKKD